MRFVVLLHASFEGLGTIGSWLNAHRFSMQLIRPYRGDPVPKVQDFDALIIMGGPQNAMELDRHPYLKKEITLIQSALIGGKKILGVCLGAQLMGCAHEAPVEMSPFREMGFFPIVLTEAGLKDVVLADLPSCFPSGHWHYQMPGLSESAVVLAESAGCPRQIVRYAPHALALQCHLELTRPIVHAFIEKCQGDLEPDRFVQAPADMLAADFDLSEQRMRRILERHFL